MQPPMQVEQLLRALDRFKTNAELVGSPQSPGSPQAAEAMSNRWFEASGLVTLVHHYVKLQSP